MHADPVEPRLSVSTPAARPPQRRRDALREGWAMACSPLGGGLGFQLLWASLITAVLWTAVFWALS